MFPYESPNFQQDVEETWETIRPLYEELHAYVRRKLRELYGPEKIGGHAPLPSHILGEDSGTTMFIILSIVANVYECYSSERMLIRADKGPQESFLSRNSDRKR